MHPPRSLLAILLLGLLVVGCARPSAPPETVARVDSLIRQLEHEISAPDAPQMSSNPFDYARSSPAFHSLSSLDRSAIPLLADRIQESGQNGLREYLLALAAENIRSDSGKGDRITFDSALEWLRQYRESER